MYSLERWAWPEKRRLSGCALCLPAGRPVYAAVSSTEELMVVQWLEQDDSGMAVFALTEAGPCALPEASHRTGTQLTDFPVFSPDGLLMVFVCTVPYWWQPDFNDDALVSPGGVFEVGRIVVLDTRSLIYRSIPVQEELPVGWAPAEPDRAPELYMLEAPEFLDPTHLSVRLWDRTQVVDLRS